MIWCSYKNVKGQRLIIWTNVIDLLYPMPCDKIQPKSFLGSGIKISIWSEFPLDSQGCKVPSCGQRMPCLECAADLNLRWSHMCAQRRFRPDCAWRLIWLCNGLAKALFRLHWCAILRGDPKTPYRLARLHYTCAFKNHAFLCYE